MKRLVLIIALMLLFPSQAKAEQHAEDLPAVPELHMAPSKTVDAVVWQATKKPPFKVRHPKIYKGFRKVRTICIFISPVVNVGSNLATAIGVIF